jgi:hypothetical protein
MIEIFQTLSGIKTSLSFIIHLIAIIALYFICTLKGIDTSNVILMVAVSYGSTQTAKQISAHIAASKDSAADTIQAIKEVNDK